MSDPENGITDWKQRAHSAEAWLKHERTRTLQLTEEVARLNDLNFEHEGLWRMERGIANQLAEALRAVTRQDYVYDVHAGIAFAALTAWESARR